jgi:hypothetical protein
MESPKVFYRRYQLSLFFKKFAANKSGNRHRSERKAQNNGSTTAAKNARELKITSLQTFPLPFAVPPQETNKFP